jgi:hypothetical protein
MKRRELGDEDDEERAGSSKKRGGTRPPRKERPRFLGIHLPNIRYEPGAQNWLIEGLLPSRGLAVLYGRWKSHKSFVALDVSMAVARGDPWAGHKVKQGAAVYVAAEGALGMRKRIAAYQARHPGDQSPFYLIEARPGLCMRPADKDELLAGIRATVGDGVEMISMVVLDTLARMVGSADENNEGMRAFADNAEDISDALECLVLAVHHENAAGDKRTRGGTSLPGAAVALWHARKTTDGNQRCCMITVEDAKDSADGTALLARFDIHELGEPEPGHERESTLIVRSVEIVTAAPEAIDQAKRASVPKNQAAFMTAFDQALESDGARKRPLKDGPIVRTVTRDQVRQRWDTIRADLEDDDTRRRVFDRQLKNAIDREDLVTRKRDDETLIWRTSK